MLHLIRSGKVVVACSATATPLRAPIEGWATVEDPNEPEDGNWVIRVDGIDHRHARFITYEHPAKIHNIVGEIKTIERSERDGKPALHFSGDLFLNRPLGKEIYETARAMEEAGSDASLYVSIEGVANPADAVKDDRGFLDVQKMRLDTLAVTSVPRNRKADWSLGDQWLPVAASMMAQYGEPLFLRVLHEIQRSGVGYPTQGMGSTSMPGEECAPLVPGATDAQHRMPTRDDYIVAALKAFPQLTWNAGEQLIKDLTARLRGGAGKQEK